MSTDLCTFTAPDQLPCPALADSRNRLGYCFAHHEIYLHDCAIAYRRRRIKDPMGAERWAHSLRLSVDRLNAIADAMPIGERPIAVRVQ